MKAPKAGGEVVVDSCDGVAAAEVAVAAVVGNEGAVMAVLRAYRLHGMADTLSAEGEVAVDLAGSAREAPYALNAAAAPVVVVAVAAAVVEALVSVARRPVHPIHSFHDHDRWFRGYVWVEAAEILTWAEKGMPSCEQRRTPLWPSSDRERSAPGLIFLDVRRVECTKYCDMVLRIAWKQTTALTMWALVEDARSRSRRSPASFRRNVYQSPRSVVT